MTSRGGELATWPERWQKRDPRAFDLGTQRSGRLQAIERLAELAESRITTPRHVTLDLGCGTGLFASTCRARHLIGLDVSMPMLRLARTRMDRVCQQDVFRLAVRPGSIDNVLCLFVVDDYPPSNKRSFFREVRELLRREGHLFLAAYSPADEHMGRSRSDTEPAVHLESSGAYLDHLTLAGLKVYVSETMQTTGEVEGDGPIRREFLLFAANT